jgi:hypothetical protein
MSTTTLAVEPLSEGVQIGMRVPGMLLALLGVVLALAVGRRLGAMAASFGAIGSGFVLGALIADVAWILTFEAMVKDRNTKPDDITSAANLFSTVYVVLFTLGLAFLVFAFFARRPADRKALPGYVSGDFATPGFPPAGYQQPGPGFGPPPPTYGPPSSFPGSPSGYPGGPPRT